jgi:hypothetical protein
VRRDDYGTQPLILLLLHNKNVSVNRRRPIHVESFDGRNTRSSATNQLLCPTSLSQPAERPRRAASFFLSGSRLGNCLQLWPQTRRMIYIRARKMGAEIPFQTVPVFLF